MMTAETHVTYPQTRRVILLTNPAHGDWLTGVEGIARLFFAPR